MLGSKAKIDKQEACAKSKKPFMKIEVYKDYNQLSEVLASEMVKAIHAKPDSCFCLATGETPQLAYKLFVQKIQSQFIDVSNCFFIGLDEWLGVSPMNQGSCHYFLYQNIFSPLGIDARQIHLFNALSNNYEEECDKMNRAIEDRGGIDLMTLGIGMNGHVGFNEPGVEIEKNAHVISLDETTKTVGQKYFLEKTDVQKGITLGFKQIMKTKKLFVAASGNKKAEIVKKALSEEADNSVPVSLLRNHFGCTLLLDEDAAAFINQL